ncbi:hypothetical protein [Duganella callida]|uniref:Uncharacterized protein n=1 Tax=Duganella callida TaxID=2561932 RepID=A0A4Y9S680_9BURK|nr:hypothetical protein [Duganella callida]TFW16883.1 hypothetical protein E4L98_22190 [Duganella callida]
MLKAFGLSLRIDVAPHAVSVLRVSRWRADAVTLLARQSIAPSGEHPFDAIGNALRAVLGELEVGGWAAQFTLSDELTRMWRVTPPPGAARMADLEGAAGLRFQSLYGEPPSAWRVAADWDAAQPFFAAAVPQRLLDVLQAVAQDCRLAIVGIAPRIVSAWNRCRRGVKAGAWFGLVHEQLLTLAATDTDGKRIRAIRPLPIPPDADQAWLTRTLQREALLLDMAPPALLQLHGAAPAGWIQPLASASHIACQPLAGSAV